MKRGQTWERYKKYLTHYPSLGLMLDISRMNVPDGFFKSMDPSLQKAYAEMDELEKGAIANPDEKRMVGHYWLRNPRLAPTKEIAEAIESTVGEIKSFAAKIHSGAIVAQNGKKFRSLLVIGIGGSALGPQFIADALGSHADKLKPCFFDNTDPDGMDRVIKELGDALAETLVIVISKSGGTKETRNGMLEAREAFGRAGYDFAKNAVAVTGEGSALYEQAKKEGWIALFPMWDWVGGRTSVTSAVGLLPAALQGINIDELLKGAASCDEVTRQHKADNPAARLALMWHYATGGEGKRDMVVLPYKDRLQFFSRYLQQLIMESLGKEKDRDGKVVNQGITVYGNKGSTDQHAYVQQLREGINNFFVTFIEVLRDRDPRSLQVEPDVTSGDYLSGFYLGTREALSDNGRESITITVEKVTPFAVGALIALYERTVGLYASLINVNAYHQPGVEAGKKAAGEVLTLQAEIIAHLRREKKSILTAEEIAEAIGASDKVETVFKVLEHIRANSDHGVIMLEGDTVFTRGYQIIR